MSFHVYVARKGFKETPIPLDEWLAAARQCDALTIEEKHNRLTGNYHHVVLIGDNRRAAINLSPYGLVHTQNPSRAMVETMFKLAGLLDAAVYSERLKKYDSVQDWEKRTKAWREKHEVAKALAGKAYSRKKLKILLLVAASGLLGWCLAYWNG